MPAQIFNQLKVGLRKPLEWSVRWRRQLKPGHHYLAICAIFKDEARFLREWITFHRGIGVDHFFLYNNNSSDDFRGVLAEFDCVTLVDWPSTTRAQHGAYFDCVRRFGSQARWLAFIDIDEFLFSPTGASAPEMLKRLEDRPAVLVSGATFGANSVASIPPRVIPAFTRRATKTGTCKSVVDPRRVRDIGNAHCFRYYGATPYAEPSIDLLRINHYWARSIEEVELKCRRGDAWGDSPKHQREPSWVRQEEATLNEVEDHVILPIAAAIRPHDQPI